ncbi:cactin [Fusarium beomiforme]|uniref:Splicing factor Cactin n=1 Tax=Fusarium beomiforme TaxID=44412 RepID=A0A9P5ARB8_9HYPO|nr:cactin [Fusarium beomiforme]
MDPGRRAMIAGRRSPTRRDVTAPRHDSTNRITKSTKPTGSKINPKYLTQDEQSRQFVADEDKFVLKQSKKKADIRIREGRAKPIDYLAFNLRFIDTDRDIFDDDDADIEIDVPVPGDVIASLDAEQIAELDSDIASYHVLETNSTNREYWKALQTICADRKAKLDPHGHERRVVSSVSEDIDKILAPKTHDQLEALEKQIKAKLQSNEDIDTDYWEQLLRSLRVWKARAKLNQVYEKIKEIRLKQLKDRDPAKAKALSQSTSAPKGTIGSQPVTSASNENAPPAAVSSSRRVGTSAPPGTERFSQADNEDLSQATKVLYDREVARGVDENEEIFTSEEAVTSSKPQWADKYRPRKPRYFNRVQMGYDWNKYNQTHYDHDNPPPKVVQGYKFNIFYPELIDKTKAPTFKIIREHGRRRGESFAAAGEEDTCLIRFIAGPPYEDIAFRIVDREWDYSAKKDRGFKSSFDKVRSSRLLNFTSRGKGQVPASALVAPSSYCGDSFDRWTN